MGNKWRDDTMTSNMTTRGERWALALMAVTIMAWLFWAADTGQDNKEQRQNEGPTCEWGQPCHIDYP